VDLDFVEEVFQVGCYLLGFITYQVICANMDDDGAELLL
jgi:hypothetical protein